MERFNYPDIAAVLNENAAILRLLELESMGEKKDERERLAAMEAELESMKHHG